MVVSDAIHNIMGGIENAGDVRLHNHRRKLKQRFDIVKKLGQGTYGKVQLGINKETGQEVAIKTIRKCKIETEADLIRIRREIQIMSSVRHPNIIHIYEVFENREKMVLVMEYAAGGELYDYLSERKVLPEEEARRIFRQIATAVYYCHKHNICHRDLKLENILLDEIGNAKIADFGLSNVFSYSSLLSTFCGSPLYASPEIVKGTPYHGPEVDCWSLGVLLYTLVYGAMPFDGSNFKRLVKQISTGNYFEPKNPSPASSLIAEMLSVNPARRADITAICNHCWMNETYPDTCFDLAEELASQTPVRLDLLLSLTAPPASAGNAVGAGQVPNNEDVNGALSRPVRSHSLGSIPPTVVVPNVVPFTVSEAKEPVIVEDKKPRMKKKERSHSRSRRKERSRSRSRKSGSREAHELDEPKPPEDRDMDETRPAVVPLVNSGTQVITKSSAPVPQATEPAAEVGEPLEVVESAKMDVEPKPKPMERRRSKVFEVAEKFNVTNEKSATKVPPPKKIILPGISVDGARKEYERRSSLADSNSPPKKHSVGDGSPPAEESFPLASTVALNKLVESAFRDEPPFDKPSVDEEMTEGDLMKILPKTSNAEGNSNKAATLPRRRTSRAEIQLVAPQFPPDNYKTEVEHFISKPAPNHKTEIVIPVSAPLPPKPLTKQDNQSKEHIIPIQFEPETLRKGTSPSSSWSASKSSIPRTSSSSLSRQSTVDSDSGSTISTGEPIRKSPREVIIPIAVEGGGYVTPREDTLTRMSSVNDSEDESKNNSRCFTLRSTKRRQPEQSQTAQLDTADSLSSDEDDNFQLLTAENLFSTLLSRVRSLTQRLNNDEMRRTSAFPRSLFAHSSIFDNMPSRRLTETRSFSRPESAPWRRAVTTNNQPQRDDSIRKCYSRIAGEKAQQPPHTPPASASGDRRNSHSNAPPLKDSKSEPPTTASPVPKVSIEEEFDSFFSKYKPKPDSAAAFGYAHRPLHRPTSPIRPRQSPEPQSAPAAAAAEEKVAAKPPRKSRFLRPDFYDTPREESKYVIQNEKVRAFRERSLSRQRELSRNRSTDSFANGLSGTEYMRSKTCSIADRMETLQRREFRRTTSADTTAATINGNTTAAATSPQENDERLQELNTAKRKSLILQNELENEIRKTQNMNSKLSGLMLALNDTENQYERKLERLYGLKPEKPAVAVESAGEADLPKEPTAEPEPELKVEPRPLPESKLEPKPEAEESGYDKLSLLEKKFAYFRKLQDDGEDVTAEPKETGALKTSTSGASTGSPDDTSSMTPPDEMDNSDAWSMISDSADAQYQDNMKDRIRRRSFYSRFNNYKQKPAAVVSTAAGPRSRPLSYSRSLLVDFKQRSDGSSRPM